MNPTEKIPKVTHCRFPKPSQFNTAASSKLFHSLFQQYNLSPTLNPFIKSKYLGSFTNSFLKGSIKPKHQFNNGDLIGILCYFLYFTFRHASLVLHWASANTTPPRNPTHPTGSYYYTDQIAIEAESPSINSLKDSIVIDFFSPSHLSTDPSLLQRTSLSPLPLSNISFLFLGSPKHKTLKYLTPDRTHKFICSNIKYFDTIHVLIALSSSFTLYEVLNAWIIIATSSKKYYIVAACLDIILWSLLSPYKLQTFYHRLNDQTKGSRETEFSIKQQVNKKMLKIFTSLLVNKVMKSVNSLEKHFNEQRAYFHQNITFGKEITPEEETQFIWNQTCMFRIERLKTRYSRFELLAKKLLQQTPPTKSKAPETHTTSIRRIIHSSFPSSSISSVPSKKGRGPVLVSQIITEQTHLSDADLQKRLNTIFSKPDTRAPGAWPRKHTWKIKSHPKKSILRKPKLLPEEEEKSPSPGPPPLIPMGVIFYEISDSEEESDNDESQPNVVVGEYQTTEYDPNTDYYSTPIDTLEHDSRYVHFTTEEPDVFEFKNVPGEVRYFDMRRILETLRERQQLTETNAFAKKMQSKIETLSEGGHSDAFDAALSMDIMDSGASAFVSNSFRKIHTNQRFIEKRRSRTERDLITSHKAESIPEYKLDKTWPDTHFKFIGILGESPFIRWRYPEPVRFPSHRVPTQNNIPYPSFNSFYSALGSNSLEKGETHTFLESLPPVSGIPSVAPISEPPSKSLFTPTQDSKPLQIPFYSQEEYTPNFVWFTLSVFDRQIAKKMALDYIKSFQKPDPKFHQQSVYFRLLSNLHFSALVVGLGLGEQRGSAPNSPPPDITPQIIEFLQGILAEALERNGLDRNLIFGIQGIPIGSSFPSGTSNTPKFNIHQAPPFSLPGLNPNAPRSLYASNNKEVRICKFYVNPNGSGCSTGHTCPYLHPVWIGQAYNDSTDIRHSPFYKGSNDSRRIYSSMPLS